MMFKMYNHKTVYDLDSCSCILNNISGKIIKYDVYGKKFKKARIMETLVYISYLQIALLRR